MKRSVLGILAHVDAGKTTLSEAMLFTAGNIRSLGRVDHGDAFLDTFAIERQRGITVFSKQAVLSLPDAQFTLLDTPGHTDFSAEMERTLDVLDCAILVISGTDGVQSHTITVWRLLRKHHIPTFVFINKMDLAGADHDKVLYSMQKSLGDGFFDLGAADYESAAENDEKLMDEYLESGTIEKSSLEQAIHECRIFPCWFGSALKLSGVDSFLNGLCQFAPEYRTASSVFGAKIYKISRDEQGKRLTHMKISSGVLTVRDTVSVGDKEAKVSQIRIYSGAHYTQTDHAEAGEVAAVVGLEETFPGQALGCEQGSAEYSLEPVLNYKVILPSESDKQKALSYFRLLEEEEPQLHVEWYAAQQEIQVRLMGPVQLDILRRQLLERFSLEVEFGQGSIQYRETIANTVEGVGHYEPLRHFAEVHLLLEPAPQGSGIILSTQCPEDELDRNWQHLVLTHLAEKQHIGVLTGSPLTDVSITLMSGKAHVKHTEGGDFRQATYRAVRHALMQAESVLLEPWYAFTVLVPLENIGRTMADLNLMGAEFSSEQDDGFAVFSGSAPVAVMQNYAEELAAYTHGHGQISYTIKGYYPCKEQDSVVQSIAYDAESDIANTADSVFCSHGAGYTVNWQHVKEHMHLPSVLAEKETENHSEELARQYMHLAASDEELRRIFERTYGPVKRRTPEIMRPAKKQEDTATKHRAVPVKSGPEYVLVDGYNIIFAWDELKKMAEKSLDSARAVLLEKMRNYQGFHQNRVILVFDAYKVKGNPGTIEHYGDVSVIYTKEAETADMYIERVSSVLTKNYRVRVATSDGLEQIIVLSHGCLRVSARQFEQEVDETDRAIRAYLNKLS